MKKQFKIIVPQSLAAMLSGRARKQLYGIDHSMEGIVFVSGTVPRTGDRFLGFAVSEKDSSKDKSNGVVSIVVHNGKPKGYIISSGKQKPAAIEIVSSDHIFARVEDILDRSSLSKKTVALVGLGAVGSVLAEQLAMAGVGNFVLIDFDTLSASNICRHACGIDDLHRYKVDAVADRLRRRNPDVHVKVWKADLTKLSAKDVKRIFNGLDLICASTDSNAAHFATNRLAYSFGVPSLYVGLYERAIGGEICFVIPRSSELAAEYRPTPCWNCIFGEVRSARPLPDRSVQGPCTESDLNRPQIVSEPAIATDSWHVTLCAMPYAIALLDPKSDRADLIRNASSNLIFVGSGRPPQAEFRRPFDMQEYDGAFMNQACYVCGEGAILNEADAEAADELLLAAGIGRPTEEKLHSKTKRRKRL